MLNFMVNAEGGLTTAGYAICIVLGIVVFGIALFFAGKNSEKNKMSAKQLACCAMAMALAFITSYIKIFSLPWGGSVTLCSMLFIVLVANWYGVRTGILVGFTYGMLQFLQEPYVLSLFQVCCDYVLASLQSKRMDCSKAISQLFSPEEYFMRWEDICTGWTTCRTISRNHLQPYIRSHITTVSFWQKD